MVDIVLVLFAVLAGLLTVLIKWKRPTWVGRRGEKIVSRKLFELNPEKYTTLNNLLVLSQGSVGTAQIDHVVVSSFGIFVIETKNYTGWIFGNAYQQHWTQVIYRYKKQFFNPLRQNYGHIKAIEQLVRPHYPNIPIIGFVAFPSVERLQITGSNSVGLVVDVIRMIHDYTKAVVSDSDRTVIYNLLVAANIQNKRAIKEHNHKTHALRVSTEL